MLATLNQLPRVKLTLFVAISFHAIVVSKLLTLEAASGRERKPLPSIEIQDKSGARIASSETPTPSSNPALTELTFEREYQPGDRILFRGPQRMVVRLDREMPECFLYVQDASAKNSSYEIPYGRQEKETGSAFAPESFAGKTHRVTVRPLSEKEIKGYRNLALNPCDSREAKNATTEIFPHATSNSVSRDLFDFEARNAIDGVTQNGHHGVWPYQSWGPQLRTDLWWKVDFGRIIELDKLRLMVRADFPHDSYWKSADMEFSDGSHFPIQIGASLDFQEFSFPRRRVSWLRLTNLVPADPAKWCSFIEVEAWGRDRQ